VTGAAALRIGAVAAAFLSTAAALAGGAASASPASYVCTGIAATDQAALEPLIAAGGAITVSGPHACVGNFVASNVSVTLTGAGAGVTMDGGDTGSVLIAAASNVTLANLTITNGEGSGSDEPDGLGGEDGGGVSVVDSTLTLDRCRVVGNHAGDQGGGVYAEESTVSIADSSISDNVSDFDGGGIDGDEDVDMTIAGSTISRNTTGAHGGGVELFDGSLTIDGSTISGNALTDTSDFRSGGGIWAGLADVTVTGSTVSGNRSTEFGGGIGYSGGSGTTLIVENSSITGNRAAAGGGGIRNDAFYGDAVLRVDGSTLIGNSGANGGAIDDFALNGFTASVELTSSALSGNRAPHGTGGAVNSFVDPSGGSTAVSVDYTTIEPRARHLNDGNQADFGAGLAANGANGSATVVLGPGAVVTGNVARFDGGGVYRLGGAVLTMLPGSLVLLNRPNNVA